MSAIQGMIIPDVLSTSQTWSIEDESKYAKLLDRILGHVYPNGVWQKYAYRDDEWSGPGIYRLQVRLDLQVRLNRPEYQPLYSLKWEGPL